MQARHSPLSDRSALNFSQMYQSFGDKMCLVRYGVLPMPDFEIEKFNILCALPPLAVSHEFLGI